MSIGEMVEEKMGCGNLSEEWRKGPWTAEEDRLLVEYVKFHGERRWNSVSKVAGLKRNGKSCRLRWVNYLRPDLKRGQITPHEERIILELHARWGNRWSTIAKSLPGRTDNEIKNYWRTHFLKKAAKSCADTASEKSRARILRKQQFKQKQQQQQQLFRQQEEQKLHYNPTLLEESNESRVPATLIPQAGIFYPNLLDEEHWIFYPLPEASSDEDIMWDGLWNLNDFHANVNVSS